MADSHQRPATPNFSTGKDCTQLKAPEKFLKTHLVNLEK